MADDLISRQAAIDLFPNDVLEWDTFDGYIAPHEARRLIEYLPSAQPDGYVKIPETGIDDLSDGFHTFRQLYYQRMMLFATIVKQNREKAWKSLRHEDGELCFGGDWFIVGIDTPEGTYTYHYEANYYSIFDCKELERARHWDGHTEKDVTRLLSLPSAQPTYTDAEIQKMQDLEQAQIEKAYQLGREDAQPPWIPCSKKVPDETDSYLVTNNNCVCPVELAVFKADGAYWTDAYVGERYKNGYILAWMPLPERYEVEE